jgi:hypothetical protein
VSGTSVEHLSRPLSARLQEGERILWQGASAPKSAKTFKALVQYVANWVLGGAAVVTLVLSLTGKGWELLQARPVPRWSDYGFGLLLLVLALVVVYGAVHLAVSAIKDQTAVQTEVYALTNTRAFILRLQNGTDMLTSIPILPGDWITGDFGPSGRIIFSRSQFYRSDDGEPAFDETVEVFKNIADAEMVFDLIRQIQTGQT